MPRYENDGYENVERAILYMLQYEGVLRNLANGRMLEFKFLILALKRYKD